MNDRRVHAVGRTSGASTADRCYDTANINLCAHEVIENQVRKTPLKIAVQFEQSEFLTYQELDDRANKVGMALRDWRQLHTPDQGEWLIPISCGKSIELVVTMLGILKAGAAYIPLDIRQPEARIQSIIETVSPSLVLCDDQLGTDKLQVIANRTGATVTTVTGLLRGVEGLQSAPRGQVSPSSLAYLLFTSGSTGDPKGVMVEHRNLVAFMTAREDELVGGWTSIRAQVAPYTFAISVADFYLSLGSGGRLVLGDPTRMLNELPEWLELTNITHMVTTPLTAGLMEGKTPTYLRSIVLAGEAVPASFRQHIPAECHVFQAYGQTETTLAATKYLIPVDLDPIERVPIGYPYGSCLVFLLNPGTVEVTPVGEEGEICVEGPQVARGYLGDAQLTKERFVPNPLAQGRGEETMMYRTGDLGCFRADGALVHLGRLDHQEKIRGQRLELAEIERRVLEHPEVHSCVVVKAATRQGDVLVAFVKLQDNHKAHGAAWDALVRDIRGRLLDAIPDYMVPAHLFNMEDEFPRTSHGKVDRRALASHAVALLIEEWSRGPASTSGEVSHAVTTICHVFRGVLSTDMGASDSFLDRGGHSILAIRAANRLRTILGVAVTFRDILECPTPLELAERVHSVGDNSASAVIPRTFNQSSAAQSFAQGRLWLLEQLQPDLTWYLMPLAVRLRGLLDIRALEAALQALEQRHETLRTTFQDGQDGGIQAIQPVQPRTLRVVNLSPGQEEHSLQAALLGERTTPFNLRQEAGWRPTLIRIADDHHVLSMIIHHIISDGWSTEIIYRELSLLYSAALKGDDLSTTLNPLPIQYRDFSIWQHQEAQVAEQKRQLSYWRRQLQGSQPAEFLYDKPRPARLSGKALVGNIRVAGPVHQALQALCQRLQVTPFIVLLAALRATHYRLTERADATVGCLVANRTHEEVQDLIGFFVNMQCMRIPIDDEESFDQLVHRVATTAMAAFAHQDVPFEQVVAELNPDRETNRNPLVQTVLAVHPARVTVQFDGLETEDMNTLPTTRFDLECHVFQNEDALEGWALFAEELFHASTVRAILAVFHEVLEQGLAAPDTPLRDLPLDGGLSGMVETGITPPSTCAENPEGPSIVDAFAEQVARFPDQVAIKEDGHQLTYSEVDRQSDQLARWLRGRALPAEALVAVLGVRSTRTILAFLAILKANLAYLPLDASLPGGRTATILACASKTTLVLNTADEPTPNIYLDVDVVTFEQALEEGRCLSPAGHSLSDPGSPTATSLAYVMFTSGSTGKPKGVMITHGAVVCRAQHVTDYLHPSATQSTVAHMASIGFDLSTWEIFAPLLNGGAVAPIDRKIMLDGDTVDASFARHDVRVAMLTPSLVKQYLQSCPRLLGRLHTLCCGGERLEMDTFLRVRKLVQHDVVNIFGPTEATVLYTFYPGPELQGQEVLEVNGVPVGRAVTHAAVHVLDPELRPVPVGVMGEAVVTGDGLARGYTDSGETERRFVMIEVGGRLVRAYRTGDRVRRRPVDGDLEFFGRLDNQVKVRGHRMELGEVEHALLGAGPLRDAVAMLMSGLDGEEERLVACVVARDMDEWEEQHRTRFVLNDQEDERQQEEGWREAFEAAAYTGGVDRNLLGRDFRGWTSMYNGVAIDRGELNEWLDDTLATLRNSGSPGHVLEVGTGSGMILFNLLDGLESYVGLEPVSSMVDWISNTIPDLVPPQMAEKIQVHVGTAADVGRIHATGASPDLVVVNSVVQYFPGADYLLRMIETLLRHGAKTLCLGDIRSYALYTQFQLSRAVHNLTSPISANRIRQMMVETEQSEQEFLVDPAWFTSLPDRLPGLIHHVEILPKGVRAINELSCYRYAAVIHSTNGAEPLPTVHPMALDRWIDYKARKLNRQALEQILPESSGPLAVSNIPHSKTIFELHVLRELQLLSPEDEIDPTWLANAREKAQGANGLDALDLLDIAQRADFQVEVSWARQASQQGGLDAIFHKITRETHNTRTLFHFPTDHRGRQIASLSNNPLQVQVDRTLARELRSILQHQLPDYMVPSSIHVLNTLPLNHNGKVDRRALQQMIVDKVTTTTSPVSYEAPTNEAERLLCVAFEEVLDTRVGIQDNFFQRGGDSLMVARLVSNLRQNTGWPVTVPDVFDSPTPAGLAAKIVERGVVC